MTYKVRFSPQARRDIQNLFDYLARHSDDVAEFYVAELERSIERNIATRPLTWQFFFLTGAPFRAYLFKLGRRNAYWIVYEVNEEQKAIDILRVWHGAQDPEQFEVR
jgi:plasmid stabilization system protein ParE